MTGSFPRRKGAPGRPAGLGVARRLRLRTPHRIAICERVSWEGTPLCAWPSRVRRSHVIQDHKPPVASRRATTRRPRWATGRYALQIKPVAVGNKQRQLGLVAAILLLLVGCATGAEQHFDQYTAAVCDFMERCQNVEPDACRPPVRDGCMREQGGVGASLWTSSDVAACTKRLEQWDCRGEPAPPQCLRLFVDNHQ